MELAVIELWSKVFAIIGLILEFMSVLIIAHKTFYPWGKKERKMKYIEEVGQPITKRLEQQKRRGIVSITLLSSGLAFQIASLLID